MSQRRDDASTSLSLSLLVAIVVFNVVVVVIVVVGDANHTITRKRLVCTCRHGAFAATIALPPYRIADNNDNDDDDDGDSDREGSGDINDDDRSAYVVRHDNAVASGVASSCVS